MCWMAAIPIAMAAASAVKGNHDASKIAGAQATAQRLQSQEMLKQMNVEEASKKLEARSQYEQAASELTNQNLANVAASGSIRAAIGEGMLGGNSMSRVARIAQGNQIREQNMVKDNYERDYQSIMANNVMNRESTASQIAMNNRTETKGESKLGQALNIGLMAGSAAATQYASGGFSKGLNGAPKAGATTAKK
ncbi:internal virion protein [Pectobacterium phage PP81]|uniref:Internal virion protein gp14 n=1 Tax=Pectobacterium phage PP81 TaxID=1927014 RepID=A0A1L7DS18_9CAUD|nr:internal virion protein [Pectobacterium phage PP81]APU03061.1 internal virion protein B [Pectobacterium phage PP81]